MLVVLLVLLMTTATATFAIHSTSTEIRAAGHARQAAQAEYIAQGGAYAAISYLDVVNPMAVVAQHLATPVRPDDVLMPEDVAVGLQTNVLRIPMQDFLGMAHAPPLETEAVHTPSLGPRNAYQPDFLVTGTDLHQVAREEAGRDLTGRGANYYRVTLTSRGQMLPRSDFHEAGDPRSYNEVAMRARAMTEAGPFWAQGH